MKRALSRFALEQFSIHCLKKSKIALLCSVQKTGVARVFPRFRQFGCFYLEFSLALGDIFLSSDWTSWLLRFRFSCTQDTLYMCYDRLQVELIKMAWLQCFLVKAFPYALPKEFTREPADTKEQIVLPEEGGLVLVLRWEQALGSKFQMQWMFNVTKRNWYRKWFETRSNS